MSRSVTLARELILAIIARGSDHRPLVKIALQLEEALNSEFGPEDPGEDEAVLRYSLLELE